MPLPNPHGKETESDFIGRFMSEMKDEYPDQKQRLAIAYSQWRQHHKEKSVNANDFGMFMSFAHVGPLDQKLSPEDLLKVDTSQRMVFGWASTPTKDLQDERISLDAVKAALPAYMEWANIREMHQPSAVGVCKQADILEGGEDKEGLYIGAKIVDDPAWKKVVEGVYKGFSIGGQKLHKVGDLVTKIVLFEISLVDRPANPDCKIEVWKAAGLTAETKNESVEEAEVVPEEKVSAGFMARFFKTVMGKGDGFSGPAATEPDPNPTRISRPLAQFGENHANEASVATDGPATKVDGPDASTGAGTPFKPGQPVLSMESDGWYIVSSDTGKHLSGPYKAIAEASAQYLKRQQLEPEQEEAAEEEEAAENLECGCNGCSLDKRVWSGKEKNDLPDSAFAYIEPGGEKDEEGKTTPRSLRHFPIKNKTGKLDPAHVRNALGRLSQSPHGSKAKAKVEHAAQQLGIGEPAKDGKTLLSLSLAKCMGGYYPSTNLSRLALLWDQLDQLVKDFQLESALEGGNGADMSMAESLETIQRSIGGLLAQKAEHEVEELNEEETEKVLLEAGITQGDIEMSKLFRKRVDGVHKTMVKRAAHHLGKAIGHHGHLAKAHGDATDALHAIHKLMGKATAGYPMEEMAGHIDKLHKAVGSMAGHLESMGDHHEMAASHLDKVMSSWEGEDGDPTGTPERSITGTAGELAQSHLTEGDVPEYVSDQPYPKDGKNSGHATVEGMEEGVTSKELLDLHKRLGELEAENRILKAQPREVKGTSHLAKGAETALAEVVGPSSGVTQVQNEMLKGVDLTNMDLNNPQDRSKLAAMMLTNINKSDLFRRDLADPGFKAPRALNRGAAFMPSTPAVR